MSARLLLTVMVLLASGLARGAPGLAADAGARGGVEIDGDLALQGEYLGHVRAVDGRRVPFGLQVSAVGPGRFEALGYQGGLPGNGWDLETVIPWSGARDLDQLIFVGPRGTVLLQAGRGRVIDSRGHEVGDVQKVRRASTTLGAPPPPGAIRLFEGTDVAKFDPGSLTPEGWLAPGAITKLPVRDFQLHLEFRVPYQPQTRDQARGNSGVYIQRRYEVQILDSFGSLPVPNGCGSLYRQQSPDLNMSFPPLAWQTYDIYFRAARWDAEGQKTSPAVITVIHNGVTIHRQRIIPDKTGAGQPESPYDGPILLQDHGDPVRFRNVWLVLHESAPPSATWPPDPAPVGTACVGCGHLAAHEPTCLACRKRHSTARR